MTTQQAFAVRKATINDLSVLADFILSEAIEAEGRELDRAVITSGVETGLKHPGIAQYWVLEEMNAQQVIGSISTVQEWSDWNAATYCWIQSIFLNPEYRGKGLIAYLLEAAKDDARKHGSPELRLCVHSGNARAINAYLREGFLNTEYKIMAMNL